LLSVKSSGPRILYQYDFIKNASLATDSLRGAMAETTWVLYWNSRAMRFMIAFVRSIFVWLDCHWGNGNLWPELSNLEA
jgi:hypothetical protein